METLKNPDIDNQVKKILGEPNNFAFIDSQNLNLGI